MGACMQAPLRTDAGVQTHGDAPHAPSGTAAALVAAAREEILRLQALNERLLDERALGPVPYPNPDPAVPVSPAPPAGAAGTAGLLGGAADAPDPNPGPGPAALAGGAAHNGVAGSPGGDAHALQVALRVSRERARRMEDGLRVRPCPRASGLWLRMLWEQSGA